MKRLIPLAVLALALVPSAASAQVVQIGQTRSPLVAPTCPKGSTAGNCRIILERMTAIQTTSDGVVNPDRVAHAGWIVAFSVGLSKLSSNPKTEIGYIHGLDVSYGGTPQLALTVLKPGPRNSYKVVAQSGTFHLIPFLGQVLTEPLALPPTFRPMTPLAVQAGDVIAITTPTWAPVLSYDLPNSRFSYRQSRRSGCANTPTNQNAQLTIGASASYLCSYPGTRVQYSATEVTNVPYPRSYVHSRRRR